VYRVEVARSRVKRDLKRMPADDRARIAKAIGLLSGEPRPADAIQLESDVYRVRVGDYRIIYKVYDDKELILIGRIARRSESTYKGIGSLFE
jgi:mRNA interferase RelE/StbE